MNARGLHRISRTSVLPEVLDLTRGGKKGSRSRSGPCKRALSVAFSLILGSRWKFSLILGG